MMAGKDEEVKVRDGHSRANLAVIQGSVVMNRMLFVLALGILVFCSCTGEESAPAQYKPNWHVYRNGKYGYEIQYPEGYELRETGREGERDGATIMIIKEEYAAPEPLLRVELYSQVSAQERLEELSAANPPDIIASVSDVAINGASGEQIEYRWQSSEELMMVELYFDDVFFRFVASSDTGDFQDTLWWEIITTFRFLDS